MKELILRLIIFFTRKSISQNHVECEKHMFVKMANGRWCEKCNNWAEHYR